MQKEEAVFRKNYMFTREDILDSINLYMDYFKNDPDLGYTKALIENKIKLCERFRDKVKKCRLPVLKDLWSYYQYLDTGTSIELWICSGENLELSDDETYIETMTITSENMLYSVNCNYVTVGQFSIIHDVKPTTVQRWLRKGKLKYAKKSGADWLIPDTSERPGGFEFVEYALDEKDPPCIDEYPLINASKSITISEDDDKRYICYFDYYEKGLHEKMFMQKEEVEDLEYRLISSGKAKAQAPIQFIPTLSRAKTDIDSGT